MIHLTMQLAPFVDIQRAGVFVGVCELIPRLRVQGQGSNAQRRLRVEALAGVHRQC